MRENILETTFSTQEEFEKVYHKFHANNAKKYNSFLWTRLILKASMVALATGGFLISLIPSSFKISNEEDHVRYLFALEKGKVVGDVQLTIHKHSKLKVAYVLEGYGPKKMKRKLPKRDYENEKLEGWVDKETRALFVADLKWSRN